MPFSHLRRQHLTFELKQEMPSPADIMSGGGGSSNGGLQTGVAMFIPAEPTTNMEPDDVVVAERPLMNLIGSYTFDWGRLFSHQLGTQDPQGNPIAPTFASFFKRLKFGTGYMTMERIDTGDNIMCVAGQAGAGSDSCGYPVNYGKLPIYVNYIRLNPHEHSWSQFLLSPALFRTHPKRRRLLLWPGKSVTFKFTPRRFGAPSYIPETLRDWSNLTGTETDQYRRVEIPGRSQRLGWIPTGLIASENYLSLVPTVDDETVGGLGGAKNFSILSPTIAFMFEHYAFGYNLIAARGGLTAPVVIPIANDAIGPMIRRKEYTTVTFADFVQPSPSTDSSLNINGLNAVGMIIQVSPYNGSTVSHNTRELFDPPRLSSIFKNTDASHPLWRFGDSGLNYVSSNVPFDLETAPVPDVTAPPVPSAGTVP